MALTVVGLFAKYGPRLGPWVGLADLSDALAFSLNELGLPTASQGAVVNGDLTAVDADQYNQLDDMVMCRAYETILNNLTDDLLREAGINEKASDWRSSFERRLAKAKDDLKDKYGIGLPIPSAGIISMNFQQQGDDTIEGV